MVLAVAVAVVTTVIVALAVIVEVLREGADPASRWRSVAWIAPGIGALVALALSIEAGSGAGDLWETGRLSSPHAMLEDSCAACHDTSETVSAEKCSSCHEQFTGTAGEYGFDAHYLYVSGDRTRAFEREHEVGCAACHVEHQGRRTDLRATFSDRQCASCHVAGDLHAHPEFDFAAEAIPDDAGLTFTHIRHVDFVLDDRGVDEPEKACLACHAPEPEGRGFRPIRFDPACGACHLTGDIESAELPVQPRGVPLLRRAGGGAALTLGVETVETVRARLAPGEQWARRTSAAQFDVEDGLVVKTGVAHADPWILHNLRRLRRALYPSGGLADLLTASADIAPVDRRMLYDEALATLRSQTDELRGRDEDRVRATLLEFDRMMEALERRISDRGTVHDDTPFRLGMPDARLTDAQIDDANAFAARVAEPCLQCHTVDRATIRRVQQTQSVLRRARFDHRPHVMLRGCLDCHTRIPFADHIGGNGAVAADLDNAAIQNVPAIENCRQCHTPDLSFDRCLTCHDFHPDGAEWVSVGAAAGRSTRAPGSPESDDSRRVGRRRARPWVGPADP